MKSARFLLSVVLAAGGMMGLSACAENPTASSPELSMAPMNTDPVFAMADVPADVAAIREANEPSAAVQAYAQARAAGRNDVAAEAAYVERMVQFGLPEIVDTQAQDLIKQDPSNGLAWAVAAYMSGKRGDMPAALSQISVAARLLPEDPFVDRTAGQLLAWYDLEGGHAPLPAGLGQSAQNVRIALGGRPVFTDAYNGAIDAMKQPPATQPVASAATPPSPAAATAAAAEPTSAYVPETPADAPVYALPYDTTAYETYGSAYTYPFYPYYANNYYGDAPWWPTYRTWGDVYWWPTFRVFVGNEHHHRDHDGDFDHHPIYNRHVFVGPHWPRPVQPGRPVSPEGQRGISRWPALAHPISPGTIAPAHVRPHFSSPGLRFSTGIQRPSSISHRYYAAPAAPRYFLSRPSFSTPRFFSAPRATGRAFVPSAGRSFGGEAAFHGGGTARGGGGGRGR